MASSALIHVTRKTALVLGGGFAGIEAAIQLQRRGLDVTLVSDRPFLYMYPLSIWVPTGEAAPDDVHLDLSDVARRQGFRFLQGSLERIDAARRAAVVDDSELTADYLVLAIGGTPLRPAGIEHTYAIGGDPENAPRLHAALEALIERGGGRIAMGFGGSPKDPSAVRGGPVFELMFNVDHLLRKRGVRDRFELTFFAPMPSPGERMGKKAVAAVQRLFKQKQIDQHYGVKLARFDADGVVFEDETRLDADLIVFVPAQGGHPVVVGSDLPKNEAGFVRIDDGCGVLGAKGVYAVGDTAALDGPVWRAKQGHLGEVMARVAAENIVADAEGREGLASYYPHVSIMCLMDMGAGAAFVYRDDKRERLVPMPLFGHWAKKAWGTYYKASKRRILPRLPGL